MSSEIQTILRLNFVVITCMQAIAEMNLKSVLASQTDVLAMLKFDTRALYNFILIK